MRVLLAEPSVRRQHPNVGLLKIGTYHRRLGDDVEYVRGSVRPVEHQPDLVYLSAIFTYYSEKLFRLFRQTRRKFPKAIIRVGGVYPSLLPEHVMSNLGVAPHVGLLDEVEGCPPAYDLVPPGDPLSRTSLLFSTRGCWRSCKFCSVPTLEPTMSVVSNWREHIDPQHERVVFYDNNISAQDAKHRAEVFRFLAGTGQEVLFDNGFDCLRFDDEHADQVAACRNSKVRFALDYIKLMPHVSTAVERCLLRGVPRSKIQVYVLYNFKDSVEDTVQRCEMLLDLGVQPYPQVYRPYSVVSSTSPYVAPGWTLGEIRMVRYFFTMPKFYKAGSFWDWRANGCPVLPGSKVNFYPEMDSVRPADFDRRTAKGRPATNRLAILT